MVKFADREFYHLRNTGGLSDVDRNRDGFSTRISDCARGDLCACEIHVRYGDIGSLARKSEAGSAADSARTAGYDRAFTINRMFNISRRALRWIRFSSANNCNAGDSTAAVDSVASYDQNLNRGSAPSWGYDKLRAA
jgi:hypothetical protein